MEGRWYWRYSRRNMNNQSLTPDRQTSNNRLKFNLMNNEFYWGYLLKCWWEGSLQGQKWLKDNCFTKVHPSMGGAHCTACRLFNRLEVSFPCGSIHLSLFQATHWSLLLPGCWACLRVTLMGLYCFKCHWAGGRSNESSQFHGRPKLFWTLGFLS